MSRNDYFYKPMKVSILFFFLPMSLSSFGQAPEADSINYTMAVQNAKAVYWKFISPSSGLFNGPEYVDYSFSIKEGHPFFQTADFRNGSVVYDGVLYENIPIVYDVSKDLVVINDPFKVYKLSLINERVAEFNIEKYHFVRLVNDLTTNDAIKTGYYQVLYSGSTIVYEREEKKLKEETSLTEGLKRFIVTGHSYYINKDKKIYSIGSKKSMLSLFKDKKSEIQQYMRKNKLNYKKDRENTLASVAAYYDQLKGK